MALIPTIVGTVVSIKSLDHHYYKSEVVICDARQTYPDRELETEQTIQLRGSSEDSSIQIGDRIVCFAFPIGNDKWEGESFGKAREG